MRARHESHRRIQRLATLAVTTVAALAVVSCTSRGSSETAGPGSPAAANPAESREGWPRELTLGLAGGNDLEVALEYNKPLAARLEKATGLAVKLFLPTSYSGVVEGMRARRVDAMQVGVFSYLLAVQEAGAEAVAVDVTAGDPPVYEARRRAEYYSVISVKKGNGIASLADLKGRTFTFVEPASTSGHLVPKTELLNAGLTPDKDVKTRFAGSHPAALIALWNGQSDASASAETMLSRMAASGQIEYCGFADGEIGRPRTIAEVKAVFDACPAGRIVAIHYSDPIPGTPFAVRGDLPAALKAAIRTSLLDTPGDPDFIRTAKRWYIDPSRGLGLPTLDAHYDQMRQMAKLLDLNLKGLQ
jgi:phosphonate transport system substrate-binding protein